MSPFVRVYLRCWVYGERPMPPRVRRCAIRSSEPNSRRCAIWEAPSPISAMAGIWELPKPQGVYGEMPHAPKPDAAAIRENARTPIRKTQAIWGANPKPPISPMVCIWENAQAPGCIWGAPHAPKAQTLRYLGGPKPHIIFFNFFIL